jgi:hypothetical protein
VIGKNELATNPKVVDGGSNAVALNILLGVQNPTGIAAATVHIDDVAKVHIEALTQRLKETVTSPPTAMAYMVSNGTVQLR